MNKIIPIFILLLTVNVLVSQQAFHNYGSVQIHLQGNIGFHINLVNDGDFDQNLGSVGFYNEDNSLTISGNNQPVFNDMEIDVPNNIILEVPVGVSNSKNFVNGKVETPRNSTDISLDYLNDAIYLNENDIRHIDGYASITGMLDFTFPVGDDNRLRPISIDNSGAVNTSSSAYFFENPNLPSTFSGGFDTNNFENILYGVSELEFWDLNGNDETQVTLTWDNNSNIPILVNDLEDLRVVGWDKSLKQWMDLGNVSVSGDLNSGKITSRSIIPNNYEILTFGSASEIFDRTLEVFTAISPNGDGLNDTFIISGIEQYPDNELSIFNRWGVSVYHKKGYDNSWDGTSEGRVTLGSNKNLPVGTYYYVLSINGKESKAGYFYINR